MPLSGFKVLPLSVGILAAIAAALLPATPPPVRADQSGAFSGTWTANGSWQPLEFLEDRRVFTFKLSGHVNLRSAIGDTADFWAECIGLSDDATGSTTRCVWRDPDGESTAYIVLSGQLVEEGVAVTGEFVGGTGRLTGLTGTLSFTWSAVYRDDRARTFTGFAKELAGTYRYPGMQP
jgi:hypothetical protein